MIFSSQYIYLETPILVLTFVLNCLLSTLVQASELPSPMPIFRLCYVDPCSNQHLVAYSRNIQIALHIIPQIVQNSCLIDPCDICTKITWVLHAHFATCYLVLHMVWKQDPWVWSPVNNVPLGGTAVEFRLPIDLVKFRNSRALSGTDNWTP